ncbi:NAD-dependent epimerase/dehydratase family protein [Streptomyces aidingensis]|uniref:Nucleoside-diphosphate-sugar epimerase n=1 Tax=Streptomyces aidingensis TaxID=910347 RepID=A0A1I1RBK0_9ACTN|nr:NAD-dependent epimerase/dehydratase family protein [Streptomyces aidingensis]SFD31731.1 Nucleoside-diphosphate-sugar epimerase [Streptomyces aidingensis]
MNETPPLTIAVTGAAGMLGSHLTTRLLADGHRVHDIDLREPAAGLHERQEWTVADIRDAAGLADALTATKPDVLVHTASALPSYPREQIRSVIVDGTRAVFEAAGTAGVARIVHISSTAVYGLPKVVPTTEEYPREPTDDYSGAKADAELVAEEYRARGRCVSVLRPKTFLGPGRMGLFSMLFEWAEEGRNFPVLGSGNVLTQMLAVEDLVDGVVTAVHADPETANDTYNLAATEFGTVREQFQAVLDAAGHGRRVVSVPAGPAVALLGGLQRVGLSPVYGRLLHKLRGDSYVSVDKAAARLGFSPRYSTVEALLRSYDWWRTSGRTTTSTSGNTSQQPWRQGVLAAAKVFF